MFICLNLEHFNILMQGRQQYSMVIIHVPAMYSIEIFFSSIVRRVLDSKQFKMFNYVHLKSGTLRYSNDVPRTMVDGHQSCWRSPFHWAAFKWSSECSRNTLCFLDTRPKTISMRNITFIPILIAALTNHILRLNQKLVGHTYVLRRLCRENVCINCYLHSHFIFKIWINLYNLLHIIFY